MLMMVLSPIYFIPLVLELLSVVCQAALDCDANSKSVTLGCLRSFFNETNQVLPPILEGLLSEASPEDARGRRDLGSPAPNHAVMSARSCGPFSKQVACFREVYNQCTEGQVVICKIMTSFSNVYGATICDMDVSMLIASDGKTCQDTLPVNYAEHTTLDWRVRILLFMWVVY